MGKYNWKDKYFNYLNQNLEDKCPVKFYSIVGIGNEGTRNNPAQSSNLIFDITTDYRGYVFSSGIHNSACKASEAPSVSSNLFLNGAGIGKTFLNMNITSKDSTDTLLFFYKDITISNLFAIVNAHSYRNWYFNFKNCEIIRNFDFDITVDKIENCIIRINKLVGKSNTYLDVKGVSIPADKNNNNADLNFFDNCDVLLSNSDIMIYRNYYLGFNNCKYKIGAENNFTPLIGDTEDELRNSYVKRCNAQGINPPDITAGGETLPSGCWVFAKNSTREGVIIKDSMVHNFEKRRLIKLGHTDVRPTNIEITSINNIPGSFTSKNPHEKVIIGNNSISLAPGVDITTKQTPLPYADSKIIWLGNKSQINLLQIINSFPAEYGVLLDSTFSLSENPVNNIEAYKNYVLRSSNNLEATINYNGVTYSSSLLLRNHIFRGAEGFDTFTGSNNARVFEILDEAIHQTIQIRIVNTIPQQKITEGNLQAGYWYFVEPDNPADVDGTIVYDGISYPVYDSFLVRAGNLTFNKNKNCHLRRCWRQDYGNPDIEVTDKTFWQNEQKPKWIDVLAEDMRCFKKYNSNGDAEMKSDISGNYIASGHESFYNDALGVNGIKIPTYPIVGTYLQIRLKISNLNPM